MSAFWLASRTVATSVDDCPVANVNEAGETEIDAGVGATTLKVSEPDFPSLVALITTVPDATAVTSPPVLTLAIAGFDEFHVITRPVSVLPSDDSAVATTCVDDPIVSVACGVDTATEATATGAMVINSVPDTPSLVAVIVTEPGAIPTTDPAAETVATFALLEVHVTTRPEATPPAVKRVTAETCIVEPTFNVVWGAESMMEATGSGAIINAIEPAMPSLVAVTVIPPGAIPVRSPDGETLAMAELLVVQSTLRSPTTAPAVVLTTAVSCMVPVATSDGAGAVSVILPTGTAVTASTMLPTMPSAVARIVVVPGAIALTTPDAEIEATAGFDVVQTSARSTTIAPVVVLTVAATWVVAPTTIDVETAVRMIVAIGAACTVRLALPLTPSTDAEMETVPGATALTAPVVETEAIKALLDVHVADLFSTIPAASRAIAVA